MRSYAAGAPASLDQTKNTDLHALGQLLPYLWPKGETEMKVRVVISMACLVLGKMFNALIPIVYGKAVDALGVKNHDVMTSAPALVIPAALIVAYGLTRALSLVFGEIRNAVFIKVSRRAMRRVGLRIFRHLHALSLRFHIDRQTGGLSRSIERGTNAIDTLLTFALFNIVPTIIELILTALILWRLFNIEYALVTLLTVVLYAAYTIRISNWRLSLRRTMNDSDSRANTHAIDSLLNHETVKYFTNEDHEARRYDEALARYERAAVKSETSRNMLNVGQAAIISLGLTIVMLLAAHGIVHGTMTTGDFVLVNTYLLQLAQPLNLFGWAYSNLKQSLVDMEKMFDLLAVNTEIADSPGARKLALGKAEIEFRDVSFAYDQRRPILKDISFRVPGGKTVAVVGASGAGKSTLSRLLFRFYDADQGEVLIDGQDVREVTQASLRRAIGIVPQDTVLFNDTLYYNIAYGRPEADEDDIRRAARLAHIDGFIASLPDGYDTVVGERGLKLSGGEKQRVAIARALLKDPPIMVFDEATSALDTNTEREIQANLREAAEGRTVLVVAHRLSTVIDADEILVLDEGEIVERGSFQDLVEQGGLFARMWQKQQAERESVGAASV
jgi:ATP-binding cassette subfamily B protein